MRNSFLGAKRLIDSFKPAGAKSSLNHFVSLGVKPSRIATRVLGVMSDKMTALANNPVSKASGVGSLGFGALGSAARVLKGGIEVGRDLGAISRDGLTALDTARGRIPQIAGDARNVVGAVEALAMFV
tara:strand:+ start:2932 stop:3315 length:384 start_codon:yes stop_codon:yes gene_type:complete